MILLKGLLFQNF